MVYEKLTGLAHNAAAALLLMLLTASMRSTEFSVLMLRPLLNYRLPQQEVTGYAGCQ